MFLHWHKSDSHKITKSLLPGTLFQALFESLSNTSWLPAYSVTHPTAHTMPCSELSAIFLPWAWLKSWIRYLKNPEFNKQRFGLHCHAWTFKKNRKCFITIDLKPQTCFESNSIYFLFVSDFSLSFLLIIIRRYKFQEKLGPDKAPLFAHDKVDQKQLDFPKKSFMSPPQSINKWKGLDRGSGV